MSRARGRVELPEYASMARRVIRAYGHRFAEQGDEAELRELLEMTEVVNAEIRHAIGHIRLRGRDINWQTIGDMAGMTRQAARQRWDDKARQVQAEGRRRRAAATVDATTE